MSGYQYSDGFFDFVDVSSGRSAAAFLARLDLGFRVGSVLDMGCGRGVWLKAWQNLGVQDLQGIDGDYIKHDSLKISREKFKSQDISKSFNLGRRFDLVECLEVAEHLPELAARTLIGNLVGHGDVVLFSAATRGQGGEFHVNEQPLEYWAAIFAEFGYRAFDYPRAVVRGLVEIEPWYRYNTILYASVKGMQRLGAHVKAEEVKAGERFKAYASVLWRLRCGVLSALPFVAITTLAKVKHYIMMRSAG